jgi:hypothetical protein
MNQHDDETKYLAERLAAHGLKLPDSDLAAMLPAIADLEAASRDLRRDRPYALEPLGAFRLAPRGCDRRKLAHE